MSKNIILCVDDEHTILETLKKQIRNTFGNRILFEAAESAQEALEVIEDLNLSGHHICLIVSDWLMPGTQGDKFLIDVHKKYPKIVKMILTGQADEEVVERLKNEISLHCCLRKPWKEEELMSAIADGIGNV